ncbi:putative BYS1 domain protein [Aspergillus saccharolyticus JOP 1030-1]|uniref:Putative BYS1 domain protein n=1 Tax=Aspergillus saccharolyticus JOP 1030-1 TaxID=1450539 RepID=A0A318ZLT9_9EURO|nr:putative BYS1 domain protein [Aspergillus saccharolyticus JOP 1030-1]PYH48496.1 putative BYS1 domain protein [Aspergillus saccharolyticus JOP 1030-1]
MSLRHLGTTHCFGLVDQEIYNALHHLLSPPHPHAGNAIVTNNCNTPIYLWSVGGSVDPRQTIQPGVSYSEALHYDPASGGVALKITKTPNGLFDGNPQLDFAYILDGSKTWYDLSLVFGDAFSGQRLKVQPTYASCPSICWPNGVNPGGHEVLTVCAQGCLV